MSFEIQDGNRECTVNFVNREIPCVHMLFHLSTANQSAPERNPSQWREKGSWSSHSRTQELEEIRLVAFRAHVISNLISRMHSVSPAHLIHTPGARNPELFVRQSTVCHFELTDSAARLIRVLRFAPGRAGAVAR